MNLWLGIVPVSSMRARKMSKGKGRMELMMSEETEDKEDMVLTVRQRRKTTRKPQT